MVHRRHGPINRTPFDGVHSRSCVLRKAILTVLRADAKWRHGPPLRRFPASEEREQGRGILFGVPRQESRPTAMRPSLRNSARGGLTARVGCLFSVHVGNGRATHPPLQLRECTRFGWIHSRFCDGQIVWRIIVARCVPQRGVGSPSEGQRPGSSADSPVVFLVRTCGPTGQQFFRDCGDKRGWPVGPVSDENGRAGAVPVYQGVALRWKNCWAFGPNDEQLRKCTPSGSIPVVLPVSGAAERRTVQSEESGIRTRTRSAVAAASAVTDIAVRIMRPRTSPVRRYSNIMPKVKTTAARTISSQPTAPRSGSREQG